MFYICRDVDYDRDDWSLIWGPFEDGREYIDVASHESLKEAILSLYRECKGNPFDEYLIYDTSFTVISNGKIIGYLERTGSGPEFVSK